MTRQRICLLFFGIALSVIAVVAKGQEDEGLESREELQAKLDDFKNPPPLANSELLLYEQLNTLNEDLRHYRGDASNKDPFVEQRQVIDDARAKLPAILAQLSKSNCARDEAVVLLDQFNSMQRVQMFSYRYAAAISAWRTLGASIPDGASAVGRCDALKRELTPNLQNQLLAELQTYSDKVGAEQKSWQERLALTQEVIQRTSARRGEVVTKLKDIEGEESVKARLPYVIAIIGGLSIVVLLVVRIFPPALQAEWINSGQVIQFVTVMVLLSVIMALGLAGIIEANTLGTLLGGIAGYVLSQGVGRAAAREVTRSIFENRGQAESQDVTPVGSGDKGSAG